MYLVDTNVLSEAAPARTGAMAGIVVWMSQQSSRLHISAITATEIQAGIAKAKRQGAIGRASALDRWLDTMLHLYGDRVLPLDIEIARTAGELWDTALAKGRPGDLRNILIAATAKCRSLTILTRNIRHFALLGVPALDPFAKLPS